MIERNQKPDHGFISFFVCRNPVDKLLSIYNFNVFRRFVLFFLLLFNFDKCDDVLVKILLYTSSTVKGANHLDGFPSGGPPPSWKKWIQSLANGEVSECSKGARKWVRS